MRRGTIPDEDPIGIWELVTWSVRAEESVTVCPASGTLCRQHICLAGAIDDRGPQVSLHLIQFSDVFGVRGGSDPRRIRDRDLAIFDLDATMNWIFGMLEK